jgi:uncharacterized protein YodC (DUF2158 family)
METKTVSKTFNEFEDFNVGDVVRLKSGGPNMTVDGTAGSRYVCVWFDSSNVYYRQNFDQGAIEKVVPAEKPEANSGKGE